MLTISFCFLTNDTPHTWTVLVSTFQPKCPSLKSVKYGVIDIDVINTETFTPLDAWSLIYNPLIKEVILPNIEDPTIQLEDLRKYHAVRIVAKHSRLPKLKWQWSGNWKTMGIRGSPFIQRVMTKD
jgi:hypothetical protein